MQLLKNLLSKKKKDFCSNLSLYNFFVCRPLGPLNYLRIWHDNSGKGDYASWYLKFVILIDLQTKERFYFLCENWLAVERGDGLIDRLLPLATQVQKTNLNYLFKKQAKDQLSDGHLWFSVFSRPVQSSFSRLDRITCCFVLLFMSMLMNILYYGVDKSKTDGALVVGPFCVTPTQVIKKIFFINFFENKFFERSIKNRNSDLIFLKI